MKVIHERDGAVNVTGFGCLGAGSLSALRSALERLRPLVGPETTLGVLPHGAY
jgi:hypothetical protein